MSRTRKRDVAYRGGEAVGSYIYTRNVVVQQPLYLVYTIEQTSSKCIQNTRARRVL